MAHVAHHGHDAHGSAGDRIADTHDPGHGQHVVPISTYIKVILSLMVLLIVTLAAAMVDFSTYGPALAPLNIIIAMTIAIVKAVIIILYFMHVRYSSKLTWVFSGAAFFWVLILFAMTYIDYASRDTVPVAPYATEVQR